MVTSAQTPSMVASVCAVAEAVLYEGYLLYPYRKSSAKNRVRWQFGLLAPRQWIEKDGPVPPTVAGSAESWYQQTECLLEARSDAEIRVRVRCLQLQAKAVQRAEPDGRFTAVEELRIGDRRHLSFDEAVPQEADVAATVGQLLDRERVVDIEIPGGEDVEALADLSGRLIGQVIRRRRPLRAVVRLSARAVPGPYPLIQFCVRTENRDESLPAQAARSEALPASLIAAHSILELDGGSFLSLLEPPEWAALAARACRNVHTFPVLAGAQGARNLILSSPIILYDYPRVAPESPGDLFDAGEIDEILSLRILTLTDDEKREARATDPRAADIVDRVESISDEVLRGLHGTRRGGLAAKAGRSVGDTPPPGDTPWWAPGADASVSPETDSIVIAGRRVARGSRVRLRPRRRGTDAHDMFLAGRAARVEAVLTDVDGSTHLAVTIEDDPAAELYQWYGRYHYFSPEEIEPIEPREPAWMPSKF
jgi:hypothetical protein